MQAAVAAGSAGRPVQFQKGETVSETVRDDIRHYLQMFLCTSLWFFQVGPVGPVACSLGNRDRGLRLRHVPNKGMQSISKLCEWEEGLIFADLFNGEQHGLLDPVVSDPFCRAQLHPPGDHSLHWCLQLPLHGLQVTVQCRPSRGRGLLCMVPLFFRSPLGVARKSPQRFGDKRPQLYGHGHHWWREAGKRAIGESQQVVQGGAHCSHCDHNDAWSPDLVGKHWVSCNLSIQHGWPQPERQLGRHGSALLKLKPNLVASLWVFDPTLHCTFTTATNYYYYYRYLQMFLSTFVLPNNSDNNYNPHDSGPKPKPTMPLLWHHCRISRNQMFLGSMHSAQSGTESHPGQPGMVFLDTGTVQA